MIDPCSRLQNLKQTSSVCALARSGLGARHITATTMLKLQTALLLMQPVWRWSPLAPLNSHLIPPHSRSRWPFATANSEQETRPLVHSGVLIPNPVCLPSSLSLHLCSSKASFSRPSPLIFNSVYN